jgi:glutathione S-transferase
MVALVVSSLDRNIALARDGKIELDAYPHVLNWIDRVKQLSGYIPMLGI